MKRRSSNYPELDSPTGYDTDPYWGYDDDISIVAVYRGQLGHGILRSSYTLANAKEIVEDYFNLDPGSYTMEFECEGKRVILNTDENLAHCIKLWRSAQQRIGKRVRFQLRVQNFEDSRGSGIGIFKTLNGHRLSRWEQYGDIVGTPESEGPKFTNYCSRLKSTNLMADQDDEERISTFLENFPTPHLMKHKSCFGQFVFWSEDQNNSSSGESENYTADRMICDKIISAFSFKEKHLPSWSRIIFQLWVPVTIHGLRLLSTCGQPFAVNSLDPDFAKYRLRSVEYQYNIDETNNIRPAMIMSGAFLNRLPQRVHLKKQGRLLDRYALECGLKTSYMLPICCPSQSSSSCVGVVEVSTDMPLSCELCNIKLIVTALEEVGLSVFRVKERIPYNKINGLKPVKDEIEDALKIVCHSHDIGLAQVWISYEDGIHLPFSSSSFRKKRMLALKLTFYCLDVNSNFFLESFADFCWDCDMFPLNTGEKLVEKTFQDYEPRFCKNVSKLIEEYRYWSWASIIKTSALLICLRSTRTDHFDYVFEFLFFDNSNYVILFESLLLTLKKWLPSFKLASGAELGDELHIIDIHNSTTSETRFFEIFQGQKVVTEASEKGKKQMVEDHIQHSEDKNKTAEIKLSLEVIKEQFGKTQKEAARNLNVHESTLKRKCRRFGIKNWPGPDDAKKKKPKDSHINQSKTIETDNGAIQDPFPVNRNEDTLTIKAEYADDTIKFHLSISEATFKTVEKETALQFNLSIGTFKLNYKDEEEEWILLKSEQHMTDCIETWRNSDRRVVRLRVLPTVQQLSIS